MVDPLRLGALELDRSSRHATLAGHPLALSARQFALLAALTARGGADRNNGTTGAEVPRAALLAAVYGPTLPHDYPPINQHIYRLSRVLRAAAAAAGVTPPRIEFLHGGPMGSAYRLVT